MKVVWCLCLGGVGESSSLEEAVIDRALLFSNLLSFLLFQLSCAFSALIIIFLGL